MKTGESSLFTNDTIYLLKIRRKLLYKISWSRVEVWRNMKKHTFSECLYWALMRYTISQSCKIYLYLSIYISESFHWWFQYTHTHICSSSKTLISGTSLVVQLLRIHLPMQGMWVQSLVGELRSHMPRDN